MPKFYEDQAAREALAFENFKILRDAFNAKLNKKDDKLVEFSKLSDYALKIASATDEELKKMSAEYCNDPKRIETHKKALELQELADNYENTQKAVKDAVEKEIGYAEVPSEIARIVGYFLKVEKTPQDRLDNIELYKQLMDPDFAAKKVSGLIKEAMNLDKKLLFPRSYDEAVTAFSEHAPLFLAMWCFSTVLGNGSSLVINENLKELIDDNIVFFQTANHVSQYVLMAASNHYLVLPATDKGDISAFADNMNLSKAAAKYIGKFDGFEGGADEFTIFTYTGGAITAAVGAEEDIKLNDYVSNMSGNISFGRPFVGSRKTTVSEVLSEVIKGNNRAIVYTYTAEKVEELNKIFDTNGITYNNPEAVRKPMNKAIEEFKANKKDDVKDINTDNNDVKSEDDPFAYNGDDYSFNSNEGMKETENHVNNGMKERDFEYEAIERKAYSNDKENDEIDIADNVKTKGVKPVTYDEVRKIDGLVDIRMNQIDSTEGVINTDTKNVYVTDEQYKFGETNEHIKELKRDKEDFVIAAHTNKADLTFIENDIVNINIALTQKDKLLANAFRDQLYADTDDVSKQAIEQSLRSSGVGAYNPRKSKMKNFEKALKTFVKRGGSVNKLVGCEKTPDDIGYAALKIMDYYGLNFNNTDFKAEKVLKICKGLVSKHQEIQELRTKFFDIMCIDEKDYLNDNASDQQELQYYKLSHPGLTKEEERMIIAKQIVKNGPFDCASEADRLAYEALAVYTKAKALHDSRSIFYRIFHPTNYGEEETALTHMEATIRHKFGTTVELSIKEHDMYSALKIKDIMVDNLAMINKAVVHVKNTDPKKAVSDEKLMDAAIDTLNKMNNLREERLATMYKRIAHYDRIEAENWKDQYIFSHKPKENGFTNGLINSGYNLSTNISKYHDDRINDYIFVNGETKEFREKFKDRKVVKVTDLDGPTEKLHKELLNIKDPDELNKTVYTEVDKLPGEESVSEDAPDNINELSR